MQKEGKQSYVTVKEHCSHLAVLKRSKKRRKKSILGQLGWSGKDGGSELKLTHDPNWKYKLYEN